MKPSNLSPSTVGLHDTALVWQDLEKARAWSLSASFLEEKTGVSALSALFCKVVEEREFSELSASLFEWCLSTGASVKKLEQDHPALIFTLTRVRGCAALWSRLIEAGYSLDKVTARFKDGAVRTTTKLGLLCSGPYCFAPDLPGLIGLLVERGVDPNERDSEGSTPLGRLNDQLKTQESKGVAPDAFAFEEYLIKGAETLLSLGALLEGILPLPEHYAAKVLQERLRAAGERLSISQEIHVPEPCSMGFARSL